jgi:hypothetical protein
MSYDLDQLHQKYGVQVASVQFATITDLAGLTLVPAVAGGQNVIHQVLYISSSWSRVQLARATGAGSAYWVGYAGQTALYEPTRIVGDSGASIICENASIGITSGSGVVRVWFTVQKSTGAGLTL